MAEKPKRLYENKDWRKKGTIWIGAGTAQLSRSGKCLNILIKATETIYVIDLEQLKQLLDGKLERVKILQPM